MDTGELLRIETGWLFETKEIGVDVGYDADRNSEFGFFAVAVARGFVFEYYFEEVLVGTEHRVAGWR